MPEASGSEVADESDYSIFENKTGLAEDMKFLASMPELCDVTFLVGDTKEPICAVKAVLAARSRVFQKMFYQAPSPQRKKEPPPKENKFRMFLKRSSEPLLNLQNTAQQRSGFAQQLAPIQEPNQHLTMIIEEFEPDVFRQLIEYIHTGCVTLQPRTLLGLMNAADYYGLEQLRKACTGFVQCCITVDTVCALLASAERYIQYKCTKSLVQKVLEFVDEHGNEVLNLGSFTLLPQHVVRLILAREELRADEFTKFQAALMWSKKYCDSNQNQALKDVIGNFLEYIQFHKIPANVLMKEVHPLGLVPSGIILNALAYQADPTSVDPGKLSPHRVKHQNRSLSVQSSLQDQYGSNMSLSSTVSDEGSDEKQHSGKYGTAEQETREQETQKQETQEPEQPEQPQQPQQWRRSRDEDEDLQRLIEQRTQFQSMRQEEELQRRQEEERTTKQEDELRKQEMQEEFDRRQKKKQEEELKRKQEEELKKKQEEELKMKQEEELKKQQEKEQEEESKKEQQEEARKQQEEEELKRERLEDEKQKEEEKQQQQKKEDELKEQQQKEVQEKPQQQQDLQEEELKEQRQTENLENQQRIDLEEQQQADLKKLELEEISEKQEQEKELKDQQEKEKETRSDEEKLQQQQLIEDKVQPEEEPEKPDTPAPEEKSQQQLEEEERLQKEEELLKQQREEEQRRIRNERKMQLQLQELNIQWAQQQDLMFQKQEEMLQQQLDERRYEERLECEQFQQLQLQLEGRKPEPEKRQPEQRRAKERKKSRKKKAERVEIRVQEAESPKQQQIGPAEGLQMTGLYIKLVVRQEGHANLVWLFKTHKF